MGVVTDAATSDDFSACARCRPGRARSQQRVQEGERLPPRARRPLPGAKREPPDGRSHESRDDEAEACNRRRPKVEASQARTSKGRTRNAEGWGARRSEGKSSADQPFRFSPRRAWQRSASAMTPSPAGSSSGTGKTAGFWSSANGRAVWRASRASTPDSTRCRPSRSMRPRGTCGSSAARVSRARRPCTSCS